MRNFRAACLLTATSLFAGVSAQAMPVVILDGTKATGILNLDIGGIAYDVSFEFAAADTAPVACGNPAVPCDAFYSVTGGADLVADKAASKEAADAINAALNGSIATTVGSTAKSSYFVPWLKTTSGPNTDVDAAEGAGGAGTWIYIDASLDGTDTIEIARFAPAAVVPIPPAAWLFGSALGLLSWIRRRPGSA